jgi:hypothetical protein
MLLTSREQALLTVALDSYLQNVPVERMGTEEMWADLYDAVIEADIDDVGEEYDPSDDDYELDWDVQVVEAFARDLEESEDEGDKKDVTVCFADCISDEMAGTLYDAITSRLIEEMERNGELERDYDDSQTDLEDFINGVKTEVDTVTQSGPTTYANDRFNHAVEPQVEPEQTKKIS